MRRRKNRSCALMAGVVLAANCLCSEDLDLKAAWRSKPIPDWTEQDARQLLTNSPWCKSTSLRMLPALSESERRDGGDMGRQQGVGYDRIEETKPQTRKAGTSIFLPAPAKVPPGAPRAVQLRWETALPVRVAEMKARLIALPTLEGDEMVLAVFGVPGRYFTGTPQSLGAPLKKFAVLKREGKKDIHAIRVEVFQRDHDLAIAYMFPALQDGTERGQALHFETLIGRFAISQVFLIDEMRFKAKLEM